MSEQLGVVLVRLRQRKGFTQLRVAEALCAVSGVTSVTRNEVSRWERQERIPSVVWLRWLAVVLEVPVAQLAAAAAVTRRHAGLSGRAQPSTGPGSAAAGAEAAGASRVRGDGGRRLSRVSIEFEHLTASVRLSATYDDPKLALAAIGAFRSMVGDSGSAGSQPEPEHAADSRVPGRAVHDARHVVPLPRGRRSRRATRP